MLPKYASMNESNVREQAGQKPDLFSCGVTAVVTNLLLQPFRTTLNFAPSGWHPFATIRAAWPNLYRGTLLNVSRGTLALTSQTWCQAWMHQCYGKETTKGKVYGVLGAATAGMVVGLGVETWFIRRNRGLAGSRFSLPLAGFYLLRELGFSLFVLGSDGMTADVKAVSMTGSTAVTAWCHQRVVTLASADNGAQSVMRVRPYEMPQTSWQQGVNLAARAGYPSNMFFWRATYLGVYKKTYNTVRDEVTPEITKRCGR